MYELIPQKLKNEALFCVWKRVIEKNKIQKKPFRANGRHHIAIPSILQTSKQPVRYRLTVMKASELVCSTTSVLWIMTEFDNNRLLFDCDNGTIELQPFYFASIDQRILLQKFHLCLCPQYPKSEISEVCKGNHE